ncbi:hypothetical protein Bbelb_434540 [Branchiostoma belcheri]|nr:hypothetical protein Bbelb_434540 [Branchiostoma belcheri]
MPQTRMNRRSTDNATRQTVRKVLRLSPDELNNLRAGRENRLAQLITVHINDLPTHRTVNSFNRVVYEDLITQPQLSSPTTSLLSAALIRWNTRAFFSFRAFPTAPYPLVFLSTTILAWVPSSYHWLSLEEPTVTMDKRKWRASGNYGGWYPAKLRDSNEQHLQKRRLVRKSFLPTSGWGTGQVPLTQREGAESGAVARLTSTARARPGPGSTVVASLRPT